MLTTESQRTNLGYMSWLVSTSHLSHLQIVSGAPELRLNGLELHQDFGNFYTTRHGESGLDILIRYDQSLSIPTNRIWCAVRNGNQGTRKCLRFTQLQHLCFWFLTTLDLSIADCYDQLLSSSTYSFWIFPHISLRRCRALSASIYSLDLSKCLKMNSLDQVLAIPTDSI